MTINLFELGLVTKTAKALLYNMQPSGILDHEGNEYYHAELVHPVKVVASMDREISLETDIIYVREADVSGDKWQPADVPAFEKAKKANKLADYKGGFFIEGWKTDFSTTQEIPLYQQHTIREYISGKNKEKKTTDRVSLMDKIKNKAIK